MTLDSNWRSICLAAACALVVVAACGDDESSDTGVDSGPSAGSSTGPAATESTAAGSSTTASMPDDTSGTTAAADSTDDGTMTGPVGEDPHYPKPDATGNCPPGTSPVLIPGAQYCGVPCAGEGDACPPGATGTAIGECIAFTGEGGSGTTCMETVECPDGEACDEGVCTMVAFWGCRLSCASGETCPDSMTCSGIGVCGYP